MVSVDVKHHVYLFFPPSSPTSIRPSLISLMVSVNANHHEKRRIDSAQSASFVVIALGPDFMPEAFFFLLLLLPVLLCATQSPEKLCEQGGEAGLL